MPSAQKPQRSIAVAFSSRKRLPVGHGQAVSGCGRTRCRAARSCGCVPAGGAGRRSLARRNSPSRLMAWSFDPQLARRPGSAVPLAPERATASETQTGGNGCCRAATRPANDPAKGRCPRAGQGLAPTVLAPPPLRSRSPQKAPLADLRPLLPPLSARARVACATSSQRRSSNEDANHHH